MSRHFAPGFVNSGCALQGSIPSRLEAVDEVCAAARELLERQELNARVFEIDLLLREFLNNAILHGNKSDPQKRVHVRVRIGRRWVVMEIADEGTGFHWRTAGASVPVEAATSGRGLAIGKAYAARIRFNRKGNSVALWLEKTSAADRGPNH